MTTLYILKMKLTQFRTNRNMQVQISRRQLQLIDPVVLPETLPDVNRALRNARRRCRKVAAETRNLRKTREEERLVAFQIENPTQDPKKLAHQVNQDLLEDFRW